jgi:hypothetical protein
MAKYLDQEVGADCKRIPGLVNGGRQGPVRVTLNYVWGLEASNEVSS